ncbi:MAG: lysozyme inhibitor LprI family protein [Hyphomicrobiales bacterium]
MKTCLATFVLLTLTTPAHAFDCAKASTAVETAICADPQLKRLDGQLSDAYAAVKAASTPPEQKMLARSQKRWIAEREYCSGDESGVTACIAQKTRDRLSLLLGAPESGPGPGAKMVPLFLVQDGTTRQWDIDMALLRFADPQTAGEKAFNRLVDGILKQAKLGPHGEDTHDMVYAMEDTLSLTFASPRLVSARRDFYINEGGAHGNYGTDNFNIDMTSGRRLAIADVVDAAGAATLTAWCKTQVDAERRKRVPDADDVPYDQKTRDATIAETVRNLGSWSIGAGEITVSFDPYALGAYAEGAYSCSFATPAVKALALKGAPLP